MIRLQARPGQEGHAEILIYGDIGYEVLAADFLERLDDLGDVDHLTIRISSDGGNWLETLPIYRALLRHPADKIVHVDGVAASAATVLAMVGREIHIVPDGWWMVHRPKGGLFGEADDHRRQADFQDAILDKVIVAYQRHVDMTKEELLTLLEPNREIWLTAEQALEMGFVTHIEAEADVPAAAASASINPSRWRSAPAALLDPTRSHPPRQEDPMTRPNPSSAESILGRIRTMLAGGRQDDPPADPPSDPPAPDPPSGGDDPPADPQLAALRSDITRAREELRRETAELRAERATARRERAEARVDRDLEALGTRVTPAMLKRGLRQTMVALASAETPLTIEVTEEGSDGESETREVSAYDAQLDALRELPESPLLGTGEMAGKDDPEAVFGDGRPEWVRRIHESKGIDAKRMTELQARYGAN